MSKIELALNYIKNGFYIAIIIVCIVGFLSFTTGYTLSITNNLTPVVINTDYDFDELNEGDYISVYQGCTSKLNDLRPVINYKITEIIDKEEGKYITSNVSYDNSIQQNRCYDLVGKNQFNGKVVYSVGNLLY